MAAVEESDEEDLVDIARIGKTGVTISFWALDVLYCSIQYVASDYKDKYQITTVCKSSTGGTRRRKGSLRKIDTVKRRVAFVQKQCARCEHEGLPPNSR